MTTESGSKQRFCLLQEKSSHSGSVPEDSGSKYKSLVLYLKEGLWDLRKVRKFQHPQTNIF